MAPSRGRLLGYAFAAAAILLFLLHRQPSAEVAVRPAETALKRRVAVCISGASRGDAALAAFAAALRTNLLEYQSAAHEFELYAWLESQPAEAQLLNLLAPRTVSTRASVVVPALLRQPEDAAIAADHHGGRASARADAGGTNRLNTLRMLYKLRGVEYLRRQASSAHDLVLRIRPDLELLALLTLPPAHEQLEVWMAWRCDDDAHKARWDWALELVNAYQRRKSTLELAEGIVAHNNPPVPWLLREKHQPILRASEVLMANAAVYRYEMHGKRPPPSLCTDFLAFHDEEFHLHAPPRAFDAYQHDRALISNADLSSLTMDVVLAVRNYDELLAYARERAAR